MVVTRSYHATKSAANAAAGIWKRKGYKVFLEYPQVNLGKNKNLEWSQKEGEASSKAIFTI